MHTTDDIITAILLHLYICPWLWTNLLGSQGQAEQK